MGLLALGVVMLGLAGVGVWLLRAQARDHDRERSAWRAERSELLTRIQRPDHVPVSPREDFTVPEREPDEWAQVGTIEIDEKWLSGADG